MTMQPASAAIGPDCWPTFGRGSNMAETSGVKNKIGTSEFEHCFLIFYPRCFCHSLVEGVSAMRCLPYLLSLVALVFLTNIAAGQPGMVTCVAMSSDGKHLVTG